LSPSWNRLIVYVIVAWGTGAARKRKMVQLRASQPLSRRPFGANVWSRADMALSVVGGMLRGANQKFLGGHARSRANFQSFRNSFRKGQQSFFQTVEVSFQSLTPMQER
jgi:hypothetical protein